MKLLAVAAIVIAATSAAQARPGRGQDVTQFCGDRYGACAGPALQVARPRAEGGYRQKRQRQAESRRGPTRDLSLPSILARFAAPAEAVCAPAAAAVQAGQNILRAFGEHVAQIVQPVRPGYVSIKTASGQRAVVAASVAPRFVAFLRDLEATGYRIKELGGYAYRRIAGTRHLSKHAFGLAIDVNQLERDRVSVPMNRGLVSRLASSNGLCSGGDWRRGDLGHFEACGSAGRRSGRRLARARHRAYAVLR